MNPWLIFFGGCAFGIIVTVLIGLAFLAATDRTPEQAKSWLQRDAERSIKAAEEFDRRAQAVESQQNIFTNKPQGRCTQSEKLWSLAKSCRKESAAAGEATGFVHMNDIQLNAALDDAMEALAKFKNESREEKEKKAAKVDPVRVAA